VIPWEEIDRAKVPGHEGEVTLLKRGSEFSIRTAGAELMNSRVHGSEDALAELTCSRLKRKSGLRILIGGLGMGYTLAAALGQSEPDTLITVSELIPTVVRWNREHLGHLAKMPLDDPRVSVKEEDVGETIRKRKSAWDAILLDVDNGPEGLTRKANDRLYDRSGLKTAFSALRPGGILAVWSAGVNEAFTRRLKQCGFQTETVTVRARKPGKGSRHTIWFAGKP
jgi:spermidine synthase